MLRWRAISAAARWQRPITSASPACASFNPARCFFGITSTCVGALGSISSKANTCSSSYTFFEGISPRTMRQNRQLLVELVIRASGVRVALSNKVANWPLTTAFLIQSHQENRAFGRMSFSGKFLGALAIVIEHAHPHPPISGRTGKALYFGCAIAVHQVVGQFVGGVFMRKAANLHRPFSASLKRSRGLHHLHFHLGDSGFVHVEL